VLHAVASPVLEGSDVALLSEVAAGVSDTVSDTEFKMVAVSVDVKIAEPVE
jgi:hypothetical protein